MGVILGIVTESVGEPACAGGSWRRFLPVAVAAVGYIARVANEVRRPYRPDLIPDSRVKPVVI